MEMWRGDVNEWIYRLDPGYHDDPGDAYLMIPDQKVIFPGTYETDNAKHTVLWVENRTRVYPDDRANKDVLVGKVQAYGAVFIVEWDGRDGLIWTARNDGGCTHEYIPLELEEDN